MTTQENTYQVIYSDGKTVVDFFTAQNLTEAKKIAAERSKKIDYMTSYYKVARCYNGGVRGSSAKTNFH